MRFYRFLHTKQVDNTQLVRPLDHRRHRELIFQAATALALAAALLAYAWQHFETIRLGYGMEELRQQEDGLLKIQRQLELEHASLTSPDRVEAIARELGLEEPVRSQIIILPEAPNKDVLGGAASRHSPIPEGKSESGQTGEKLTIGPRTIGSLVNRPAVN